MARLAADHYPALRRRNTFRRGNLDHPIVPILFG
jgi:hypothetical protein